MKKIFVDCDILLDVGLEREPFYQTSSKLLNYLEAHPNTGFIAWHSISNVFYIFSKATTQEEAKNFILESSVSDKIESIVFTGRAPMSKSASTRQQSCLQTSVNSLYASSAR